MLEKLNYILIAEGDSRNQEVLLSALDEANITAKRGVLKSFAEVEDYYKKAGEGMSQDFPVPDVFILDMELPGGDAMGRLDFWKKSVKTKLVTIVTSRAVEIKHLREAYAAGADTHFSKPVTSADLMNFLTFRGFSL